MRKKGFYATLNPAVALCGAFLLSCVIACLNSVAAALTAVGAAVFIVALAAPEASLFFRRLVVANVFILVIWTTAPWSTPGDVVWQRGFLKITGAGLRLSALVTLKANAIFCVFMAFVFPMSATTLGGAMRKLGFPPKLIWLLLLMGRNIHVLAAEWRALSEAARLRGFRPRNSRHTYKTIAALFAIFLVRTRERAERIREAMLLRAFSGALPISGSDSFARADFFFSIFMIAVILLLLGIEGGIAHG
ncbi:MAG: energy-coupling factor transporter transmembrane protein EcfT [Desulfovibrio sp.]|nr:energy-coupling factor transporter transmembrane protein EcfT [Desulfovibrio sp.]